MMALTGPGQGWSVTGQRPGVEQGQGGQFVRGTWVDFMVGNVHDSVFVPATTYASPSAPQIVRDLIAAKAAKVAAVQNLTG